MNIDGDKVIFETDEGFYNPERTGLKPYTIRILDPVKHHILMGAGIKTIRIEHSTSETFIYFERKIHSIYTLAEVLGKILVGIAWIHEEEKECSME